MKGCTTTGVFLRAAFLPEKERSDRMVLINGKEEAAAGLLLKEYLKQNNYPADGIAVECNEQIVPKSRYDSYVIQEGDVLEVVSFVGGG